MTQVHWKERYMRYDSEYLYKAKHMKKERPSSPVREDGASSTHDEGPRGNPSQSANESNQSLQDCVKYRILCLSEQLRVEKTSRDKNTVGYLKLASKAGRHKAAHIRQAFEKVNQRSSATIAHLECKLRQYQLQLQEMEEGSQPKRSKPEERARKTQKLTDQAPLGGGPKPRGEEAQSAHRASALEEVRVATALLKEKLFKRNNTSWQQNQLFLTIKKELEEIKTSHGKLELSYHTLKEKYLTDLQLIIESLQEEKHRQNTIEEQVNEHVQGQLDDISRIKQNLACTEEKMIYLSYERAKEIWEVIETFENRISKLETQQLTAQLEMTEKPQSHSQVFLFRFMSLLLTLTTIVLICVSTICSCHLPFFKCRLRACIILLLIALGIVAWQEWYNIPHMHWHEWFLTRWKSYYKDSRPVPC
ncbi:testis-specific protein TEX28 [Gracilinanus agilis]|uniref:testis-specific protein TEX28 n=1 Tax=Gracilinanus agilis TaxID=191870 RepID=UPI001CFC599A|nr:testis-specific protein TEX28 [Gracilinanus agilis]